VHEKQPRDRPLDSPKRHSLPDKWDRPDGDDEMAALIEKQKPGRSSIAPAGGRAGRAWSNWAPPRGRAQVLIGPAVVDAQVSLPLGSAPLGADEQGGTVEVSLQRTRFAELLRDLVARGRAAGVIVLAATQKPSADVVPSALQDLFGFRLALRCTTPQASDTILGQGWASQGHNAGTIPPADRGVGYLLAEDGLPVKLRTFYLDDDQITDLATRAHEQRHGPTAAAITTEAEGVQA
jgi:hypothetical protein